MKSDQIIALAEKHGFKLVGGDYAFDLDDIRDLIEDALTAQPAAPAVVPDDWQPIETAPKDGAEVLLGSPSEEEDDPGVSVPGYWQAGYEDGIDYMGCDDGFVDSHHQTFHGGRSFGAESHRYAPNQPTHWMPLPTPPQGKQS